MSRVLLTAPNRCQPVAEWPQADRTTWNAARHPDGGHDGHHFAAHWGDSTWHTVRTGYGRWLTWLARQGGLQTATDSATRVTPACVGLYVAELTAEVAPFSVAARIEQLGNAMRILAPNKVWSWLQQDATRIRVAAKAARKKASSLSTGKEPLAEQRVRHGVRSRPQAEWPALDRVAWEISLKPGDVLDPGGIASTWAPATRTIVTSGYGRWLTWLAQHDALDPLSHPADRVTHALLTAYLKDLRATVAPFTVAACIENLGNAMRVLAPDDDWRWVQRAADRICVEAVSVRDKRARIQSPDQLVALGIKLMAEAEDPAIGRPVECATRYRDGLLIALLAMRPLRARNLVSIIWGRHLVRRGSEWWLVFPAAETKTRQELEFPFPTELAPALHRYLEHHRPVLLARGRQHQVPITNLWTSSQGTAMGSAAIGHQLRLHTMEAFGKPLSPHMFRDCAATAIAIHAPEQMRIIQYILGHAGMATAERHYNLAGSLEASRRYGATIRALRMSKLKAPVR